MDVVGTLPAGQPTPLSPTQLKQLEKALHPEISRYDWASFNMRDIDYDLQLESDAASDRVKRFASVMR